ncbi:uncharacterized protein LOC128961148 [Oppia nitens]|uniref:uncharacterized protein LOC128961148 n=1 Tax=Oppia nitens TaxID=1686743 RepID=UPI0023DB5809|nr:uncharacterized protein LOC128961148 [Oppia nitens]
MISKYISSPILSSQPSVPSTSCSSNEDEETERLASHRPLYRPIAAKSCVASTMPTATITGLPYKSKKSNIFSLTTANTGNGYDVNGRTNNPFTHHNGIIKGESGVTVPYNRRQFRSKSTISTDPKSPYFSSNAYTLVKSNRTLMDRCLSDSAVNQSHHKKLWNNQWGQLSGIHIGRPENGVPNGEIPGLNTPLSPDDPKAVTIHQHYYPEGHWGWILTTCVCLAMIFTSALTPASGFIIIDILRQFPTEDGIFSAVLIGCLSTSITLFLSPVVIAICRRKSIRLIAILGGLITALGCLFTSFATQFHQLFVSYGVIVGIGVSMIRETAVIMIGQYFKKKREFVELFVIASSGLGIAFMPLFLTFCIRSKNWRFGFQALALITFMTFFLAVLYRPASLYHPQRRAILHLKSLQKRSRIKDKLKGHHSNSQKQSLAPNGIHMGSSLDKPPYFDFSVLKSRTIQILICGTCISSFGTTTPLILMTQQGSVENIEHNSLMALQAFMGIGMALGSTAIGAIIVKNSVECMIARQYLCQASCFMLSATLLTFTTLDDYSGYVLFVWIYGFFYGGYQYSLKMFIYEKVRARNFNRAWGYVQFCQSIPTIVGIPISAFLNDHFGDRSGYYMSSLCIALGSLVLFFIDAHKKRVAKKRKISSVSGTEMANDVVSRRCSHEPSMDLHQYLPALRAPNDTFDVNYNRFTGNTRVNDMNTFNSIAVNHMDLVRNNQNNNNNNNHIINSNNNRTSRSNSIFSSTLGGPINGELTCISEEIVLDNLLEDTILDECLTSCNREDKYLMLSEFENNLNDMSEEAKAIIRKRKEDQKRSFVLNGGDVHEDNCPLSKIMIDNRYKVSTNPLQKNYGQKFLTARQRRASFAGITANGSSKSDITNGVIEEENTSDIISCCPQSPKSCPNCGDQMTHSAKMLREKITEEDEDINEEEDSINV